MKHHNQQALRPQQTQAQPQTTKPAPVNDGLGEIAHAYALVQQPDGRFVTVHLEGVTARKVERLEPNGRPELGAMAVSRCANDMEKRLRARKWGST